jgi:hypothetical protein
MLDTEREQSRRRQDFINGMHCGHGFPFPSLSI